MKITGNENAFPITENIGLPGLTIRQQFAMAAMQGYISAGSHGMPDEKSIALLAVKTADALIAELNKSTV